MELMSSPLVSQKHKGFKLISIKGVARSSVIGVILSDHLFMPRPTFSLKNVGNSSSNNLPVRCDNSKAALPFFD